jgi:hypothetical protein
MHELSPPSTVSAAESSTIIGTAAMEKEKASNQSEETDLRDVDTSVIPQGS